MNLLNTPIKDRPFGIRSYVEILEEGLNYIEDRRLGKIKSLTLPWDGLNNAGVAGLEWGSMITIGARPGCLSGDTIIDVYRHSNTKNGNGSRKYTLKELYYKFNGLLAPRNSKNDKRNGHYWDSTIPSKIYSYNKNEQYLDLNNIVNVIESGIKETFVITTESGKQLKATKDHRFLISENDEYLELENLNIGDYVYCRTDKHINKGRKPRPYRFEYTTKMPYYPSAKEKKVKCNNIEYTHHRIKKTRAVYDAALNNVTLDVFLENVKTNPNHNYKFSDVNMDIHHIDENPHNDVPENLVLLTKEEHSRLHSLVTCIDRLNRKKIVKEKIISIVSFGKEMTYDIEMTNPYNNFVANEFVVHNSGKTMFVSQILRESKMLNPTQNFNILEFQFEMGARQTAARDFASQVSLDYNQVLSTHKQLDEFSVKLMRQYIADTKVFQGFGNYRVQINDPLTVTNMEQAIYKTYDGLGGKPLIVSIDHSFLVKKDRDEKEKLNTLYNTVEMLMKVKNKLPIVVFMISQLNRSIDDPLRKMPGTVGNYPTSADIFGGDALQQGSDMVLVLTRPFKADIEIYGRKEYVCKTDDIFGHILKARNSADDTNLLFLKAEFSKQRMIEIPEPVSNNPTGAPPKRRTAQKYNNSQTP